MSGFSEAAWQVMRFLAAGEHEKAECLICRKPSVLAERNSCGESPLVWLAIENHVAAVAFLLDRGESVNELNDGGSTAVHHAAQLDLVALLQCLLRHQPNVNIRNRMLETPLDYAAQSSETGETVTLLIAAGADVHAQDALGDTALAKSAARCNAVSARCLLQGGADPNARNASGESPVHRLAGATFRTTVPGYARSREKLKAYLDVLREFGGDIDARDDEGDRVLEIAARRGNDAAVRCLRELGVGDSL